MNKLEVRQENGAIIADVYVSVEPVRDLDRALSQAQSIAGKKLLRVVGGVFRWNRDGYEASFVTDDLRE